MDLTDLEAEAEALANCDAEPIHTIDHIQAHGFLVVCDEALERITHVSDNIRALFALDARTMLKSRPDDVFGEKAMHILRGAMCLASIHKQREYIGAFPIRGQRVHVAAHIRDARVVLEFIVETAGIQTVSYGLERLRWLSARQDTKTPLIDMLQVMVRDLRAITGFDRVMVYRFRPDGSGEVIAESHLSTMNSFLGLRFPAQDVPQNARAICLEQPVRAIADTSADDIPVRAASPDAEPLDLTLTELRGTSAVHRQYLRNMGVGASLVLPILVGDALWGVFSCHNKAPRALSMNETLTYELVGQILNTTIRALLDRDARGRIAECETLAQRLVTIDRPQGGHIFTEMSWDVFARGILKKIDCDGMLLLQDREAQSYGLCPPEDALAAMSDAQFLQAMPGICATDKWEPPEGAASAIKGAMRIDVLPERGAVLWLFRREEAATVTWAGAPHKDLDRSGPTTRLHPRKSFETYVQATKGRSKFWEPDDIAIAQAIQTVLSATLERHFERTRSSELQRVMIQELNHRAKNILSLIQAVVTQTASDDEAVAAYSKALVKRLQALAYADDLINHAGSDGLSLHEIFKREVTPFSSNDITLNGPEVRFGTTASTLMVLILHEIITNAAKYGALSVPQGKVEVTWALRGDVLDLLWREHGGPPPRTERRSGFGQFLIEEAAAHQLGGTSSIAFLPGGVIISICIPVSHLTSAPGSVVPVAGDAPPLASLFGHTDLKTVMVLDDSFLIAAEVGRFLRQEGMQNVITAGTNAKALALLDTHRPDCAIIDINLGHEDSFKTAQQLRNLQIPFVFLSGYSDQYDWLDTFPESPLVRKPFAPADMSDALVSLLKI